MSTQKTAFNTETGTYDKDQSFILNISAKCTAGQEDTSLEGKLDLKCSQHFITNAFIGLAKEHESIRIAIKDAAIVLAMEGLNLDLDGLLDEMFQELKENKKD